MCKTIYAFCIYYCFFKIYCGVVNISSGSHLQILVATPGRLLDHIETRSGLSVRLMGLKMLVLDEADHLLDLGFRKDVEKIVDCLPRQRQSLLFSATIPKEVTLSSCMQYRFRGLI